MHRNICFSLYLLIFYPYYQIQKDIEGAHGVEPWTSRSAVECSTTELYPLGDMPAALQKPCVTINEGFYSSNNVNETYIVDWRDMTNTNISYNTHMLVTIYSITHQYTSKKPCTRIIDRFHSSNNINKNSILIYTIWR